jgi:pilus assembly protein CpaE
VGDFLSLNFYSQPAERGGCNGKVVLLSSYEESSGTGYELNSYGERESGLSIAIVDPDFERGNAVSAVVCSMRPKGATPRITRLRDVESPQALRNQGIDVVLIALDGEQQGARQTIDVICQAGGLSPIVYGERPDGELLIQCMRAGVRDFLQYPFEQDAIQEAFRRWERRGKLTPITRKTIGRSFVFLGAKGGTGVTSVACNFAVELAQESGRSTLLIDLDLPLGDAALSLGVKNEFSTLDALRESDRLDATYLSKLVARHESGIYVLGAPGRYVRMLPLGKPLDHLLGVASNAFDYVVVDAGSRPDMADTELFHLASTIYLVTQTSVSALRNANRLITEYLQDYSTKIEVVWNRYMGEKFGVDDGALEEVLTLPAHWKIPNDFAAVRRMQDTAEPLEQSGVRRTIKKMALAAAGMQEEKQEKKKAGMFGFLRHEA